MGRLMMRLAVLLLLVGAAWPAVAAEPLEVFVSILPQRYFVERIGGEHVRVGVLVGPGQSPATYEPTPRQMARLAKAQVFFRVGVAFETSLLRKIASISPNLPVVDTRRGVRLLEIGTPHHHGDQHAAGKDPHIWLDPKRVRIQAQTIAQTLRDLVPGHAEDFARNLAAFQADLNAVDARITALLAPLAGRSFLVFHPAYGYFADSYGLKQIAVETAGKSPGPRRIAQWIDTARREGVRIVFVQPQFSAHAARTIATAIDGAVVPLDPLAADYLANLEAMAGHIETALGR